MRRSPSPERMSAPFLRFRRRSEDETEYQKGVPDCLMDEAEENQRLTCILLMETGLGPSGG